MRDREKEFPVPSPLPHFPGLARHAVELARDRGTCELAVVVDPHPEAERTARALGSMRRGARPSSVLLVVAFAARAEAARYSMQEEALLGFRRQTASIGTPETVLASLGQLKTQLMIDEFMLVTICPDPEARRRSYELLAEANRAK